ncbi:hypothetical protein FOL47_000150 [Perkinsus chesapeaki]|uniref:MATH domain-containing protein n=1 Tax=Perkinsus chesapeaki TaxID=330153 RepID=A0A7J6MMX0_PERCH|nr:hypothetical protein FOL47_000150 [Perkinsus chesapeaki]
MPKGVTHEDLALLRSELIGMIEMVKKSDFMTAMRPLKMDIEKFKTSIEMDLPEQIKKVALDSRLTVERKLAEAIRLQEMQQTSKLTDFQKSLDRTRADMKALEKRFDGKEVAPERCGRVTWGQDHFLAIVDDKVGRMQKDNLAEVARVSQETMASLEADIKGAIAEAREKSEEIQRAAAESAARLEQEVKSASQMVSDRSASIEKALTERMQNVEEQVGDAITVAHNLSTRRVQWKMQEVSRVLGEPRNAQVFSPPISAGGAGILRLEVRVQRLKNLEDSLDPRVGGDGMSQYQRQQPSDCSLFLWAPAGTRIVFELHVGDKWGGSSNGDDHSGSAAARYRSIRYEHSFNATMSAFGGMDFLLKQFTDWIEDSLTLGVEILEIQVNMPLLSTLKSPQELAEALANEMGEEYGMGEVVGPLPLAALNPANVPLPKFDNICGDFPQSLNIMRYTSHRVLDQVRRYVEEMKNRSCKRVEWKIENVSVLARTFAQGRSLQSCSFTIAGLEQVRLVFYPSGYFNAATGYCSLYLRAPPGTSVRGNLFIGRQTRNVTFEFDGTCSAFGRANFCLLESAMDLATGSVVVGVEIVEGKQVLMARLPGTHPSSIKMVRSEGGTALEGVREVSTDVMAMTSEEASQMLSTSSLSDYVDFQGVASTTMDTTLQSLPQLGKAAKLGPYRPTWEPVFDLFGTFDPDPVVQKMVDSAMERAHFQGKDWAYRRMNKTEKVGYIRNPPPMPWCIYSVPGPADEDAYKLYLGNYLFAEDMTEEDGVARHDIEKDVLEGIMRLRLPQDTGHSGKFGVDINLRAKPKLGELYFREEPRNTKRSVTGRMMECNKYVVDFSRPMAIRSLIPATAPAIRSAVQDIIDFSVEYASSMGLDPDNALSFRILVKVAQQPWHVEDDSVKEAARVVMEWLGTRHLARFWDYITVDATRIRAHAQLPHFERQGLGGAVCVSPHELEGSQGSPFFYDSRYTRSLRTSLECPAFQLWERFPNTAFGCGEKTGTARQVWVTFGYRLTQNISRAEAAKLQEELSWAKPGLCFTAET